MEGGGIRGITYAGAIEALEERGMLKDMERVAGTSVGAVVAGLLAVGYTSVDLRRILEDLRLQAFNDGRWIFFGGMRRMQRNYGWYMGNALEDWMGRLIAAKTGSENTTLMVLHSLTQRNKTFKDLYAVATNLSLQRREVLCYTTYPNMPLKTAIRASMSIPLYFGAIFIDNSGTAFRKQDMAHSRQVLVDGGIVANYPLDLFDTGRGNPYTLGLKLERPEQLSHDSESATLAPFKIDHFQSYVAALYNVVIEQLNKASSYEDERRRTVYISTGSINPRVRKISKEQKDLMYNNGREAVKRFMLGRQ
jgi:NTE family protein